MTDQRQRGLTLRSSGAARVTVLIVTAHVFQSSAQTELASPQLL